jgi:ABC-type transport system involved in multi-copper enzyme maturation permease subunit
VWVLLSAGLVLNQIFGYLVPYLSYLSGDSGGVLEGASQAGLLASTLPDQLVGNTIGGFPVFAGALALVLGALMFGGEYGWGTVKTLFIQRPGRVVVLAGQLLALAIAVLVGVLVMFGVGALSSAAIAAAENQPLDWPTLVDLVQGVGTGWLILLMWAVLGAFLGVALRGVALPIGLGVVWVLGVENLISAVAGTVFDALQPLRDVLPGVNAGSLVSAVMAERLIDPAPGVTSSVSGGRSLVTLVAYVVVCAIAAVWTTRRRDVV